MYFQFTSTLNTLKLLFQGQITFAQMLFEVFEHDTSKSLTDSPEDNTVHERETSLRCSLLVCEVRFLGLLLIYTHFSSAALHVARADQHSFQSFSHQNVGLPFLTLWWHRRSRIDRWRMAIIFCSYLHLSYWTIVSPLNRW